MVFAGSGVMPLVSWRLDGVGDGAAAGFVACEVDENFTQACGAGVGVTGGVMRFARLRH